MSDKKTLGTRDVVLYVISALLFLDQLTAAASVGPQAYFWWAVIVLVYVIPYILVVTELATTYPNEGGIYDWIKRGFGSKAAGNVSWLYWINMMLFVPTAFLLFAGIFSQIFMPELSYMGQSIICLFLILLMTAALCMDMKFVKWLPNIGAILKLGFILIISVGGIYLGYSEGAATEFSADTMMPQWGVGIGFLAMIVFNVTGWDTIAAMSRHIKDPAKSIPKGFAIAGVIVVFMYLMATTGILAAVPVGELGLISGFVETIQAIFGGNSIVVTILGGVLMFTFFTNNVTWCMAANEAAMAAGKEGELPKIFGKVHPKTKAPIGAAILGGIVATVEVVLYGMMANSAEDLFWLLLAFSTIIFFLPYLAMFIAFIRLRHIDPDTPRPFKVPGSSFAVKVLAMLPFIVLCISIWFLLVPPGEVFDPAYLAAISAGCFVVLAAGYYMVNKCSKTDTTLIQEAEEV